MSKFWEFKNQGDEGTELQIEGDIIDDDDAWLYEWFGDKATAKNAFKEELSKYKGQDIIVWIDSYGGNVFAAAGIYNALKEHSGKIVVKIDGKAMSAASVIAMAGDEISISPVGVLMIHNPLTYAQGDARVMRKTAEVLDVIKETLINSYRRSGKTDKELWKMLDDETWMSANVAVKEGFADSILYEEEPLKVENLKEFTFNYNRLAVVNNANASLKRMLTLERESVIQDKGDDLVDFKTIEELKNAYPDLIKEVEDKVRLEERERIKGIEEISNSIDPKLVFKAKFEEPLNAEKLAFEALKADGLKGKDYLKNKEIDNKGSGVDDIEVNPLDDDPQPKTIKDKARNIAARFDSKRRGVVIDG